MRQARALTVCLILAAFAASCGTAEPTASVVQAAKVWVEEQKLAIQPAPIKEDSYGASVAIRGSTALVGAPGEVFGTGAVYVFQRTGRSWSNERRLITSDGGQADTFGSRASLSGDTALLGAFGAKAAYVFTRVGSTWAEQTKLTGSDSYQGDQYGAASALDGDTAIVGAVGVISGPGAAYVYARTADTWTEQQKLKAPAAADDKRDNFGAAVALSGETAVITATAGPEGGLAHVFVRSGTTWSFQQTLVPDELPFGSLFGDSAAIDGDTAIVGGTGFACVFVRSGNSWTQQELLEPSDAEVYNFGRKVAIQGDLAVVGGQDYNFYRGRAYVFVRSGTSWTETKKLDPSDASVYGYFGSAVATDGRDVAVGTFESGAYVFHVGGEPGDACATDDECATGACAAEGICCDVTCAGPCESCLAARKASGPDGECGVLPADTECGPASCPTATSQDPRDSCDGAGRCVAAPESACQAGYSCVDAACKTACETDQDCDGDSGFVCGSGECKVPSAEPCTSDADCDSAHCADGLCCDKACQGQCEACAEPRHEGICVAVTGAPRGEARAACDSSGDAACAERCDGANREACQYVPTTVACACPSSAAASYCDGQGSCAVDNPVSCEGFVCRADACLSECNTDDDCTTGYRCRSGQCEPSESAHCSDDLASSLDEERSMPCAPYKCDVATGTCLSNCTNSTECQGQAACDTLTRTCQSLAAAEDDASCACRGAGVPARGAGAWLLLAMGLASARARRQRRQPAGGPWRC